MRSATALLRARWGPPVRGGALSGRQGDSARAVQRRSLRQEAKDQHARNILNAEKRLADAKAAEKAARDQELSPLASLVPRVGRTHKCP